MALFSLNDGAFYDGFEGAATLRCHESSLSPKGSLGRVLAMPIYRMRF